MEIYVNGQRVAAIPELTLGQKLQNAAEKLRQFWYTPLRKFWQNVYVHYYDEFYGNKKAGKSAATDNPASDNHDGKPAA